MRTLGFVTVDVFTDRRFAGNPLAVFPEVGDLSTAAMQALAREINYSETTFVVRRDGPHAEVRIFTPTLELPFAGHPTLGTAAVLTDYGARAAITLALGVGPVPVAIESTAYGARCELIAPPSAEVPTRAADDVICRAVGVAAADRVGELPIQTWSSGNPFTLVAVRSLEAVARSHPVRDPAGELALGIVVFALIAPGRVRARVFVPADRTIPEDPATGSANAPLATYLARHGRLELGATLHTEQGFEMGRPSRLEARLERDPAGRVCARVAGGVVPVFRGSIDL